MRKPYLGGRHANLCFHFAGSGENLPDIAKSRDSSIFGRNFDEASCTASCYSPPQRHMEEIFTRRVTVDQAEGLCHRIT